MATPAKTPPIWRWIFIGLLSASLLLNSVLLFQSWRNNTVAKVVDGDTIDLVDGRRVRLLGIDAPEKGRCMHIEAKALLTNAALGRHVRLKNILNDEYGRILATVIIEDPKSWMDYVLLKADEWVAGRKGSQRARSFPLWDTVVNKLAGMRALVGRENPTGPTHWDPLLNRLMLAQGLAEKYTEQ